MNWVFGIGLLTGMSAKSLLVSNSSDVNVRLPWRNITGQKSRPMLYPVPSSWNRSWKV